MNDSITFKDGLPVSASGFGVRRNFYQSGRISAKVADIAGVFELNYVGRQHFKNQCFYSSNEQCTFQRCMVVQVLIDGRPYRLAFENTTHYPFGYRSECTLEDVRLQHELVLDRNALFRRVTVLANPSGKNVRCRLVHVNAGMGQGAKWRIAARPEGSPHLVAEARFEGGATVTMEIGSANPVTFPDNSLVDPRAFPGNPEHVQDFRFDMEERRCAALPRSAANDTNLKCSQALNATNDTHGNGTLDLSFVDNCEHLSFVNNGTSLFWWVFDPSPDEDLSSARVDRVFADIAARRTADARFETGDAYADGHLGFVPAMAAAYEVDGIGAFRASPTYWVWGWDALVHSGTLALCGRAAEMRRMLAFFRDNAGPGGAIEHAYSTDFSFQEENISMPGETCFYPVNASFWLILLDEYVNATGDTAFQAECMDFARSLVERNRREVAPFLLPRGQGWIPDNRYPLGQEKDDFCLSNCSVYWQGLCAWRDLSGEDVGVEAAARDIVAKFWDAEAGYWCDSWDAKAARPRPFRPLHGFYHVSRFAREVFACAAAGGAGGAAPRPAPIAAYMERHFLLGDRLAMYDREDLAIRRADGNQFGAYYPVQDRTFWNAMNLAGRTDSLALFRRIVGSHGRVLTYPEGQTVDVLNADPADYSDELGNKQFFAAKGWLADALDLWLGIGVSKEGVFFHPMNDGTPFVLRGLHFRHATLDIEMSGAGTAESARFALNGEPLAAGFIPFDALRGGRNTLAVSFVSGASPE